MPSQLRIQRIADRILQEISEMLIRETSDPRLSGIFPTNVKVDRELTYADIYVSAIEGKARSAEAVDALAHASGFFRKNLSQRIQLRTFPRLRFHWDPTPENADRIERLIISLHQDANTSARIDDKND